MGPWKLGIGPDGPAIKAQWLIGEDAKLRVGAGINWQGRPQGGIHVRIRF